MRLAPEAPAALAHGQRRPDPALGVFESLLVVDGKAHRLAAHLAAWRQPDRALRTRAASLTSLVDALRQTSLLLDADGTVLEAGWANVLIRRGGILLRPRADGRILAGTSLPAAEQADLTLADLRRAVEILVCSSIAGVVPAVRAEDPPERPSGSS